MADRRKRTHSFVCPNCGEEVPAKAACCPHCGSDDQTGWAPNAETSHIDPTFDEQDYDHVLENEFGSRRIRPGRLLLAGISALLILLWMYYLMR